MDKIKALVSKEKKRYQEDGYDLDLTYIKSNIIAMGYPAEKLEGVYRNNIDDVARFLDEKHMDHYRIYNLCAERSYDPAKFHNRVITFPMEDHNPPSIELFEPFCKDMDDWLNQNEQNIAAVHCKAGKGRTGVMICAYLLHSKQFDSYNNALTFYGQARTKNHKGVTIPSQRRYVQYFGFLKHGNREYDKVTLLLKSIQFSSTPNFNNSGSSTPLFVVNASRGGQLTCHNSHGSGSKDDGRVKLYSSHVFELKRGQKPQKMRVNPILPVCGDIQIEFYNKSKVMKKERMCHFWFNTFFVSQMTTDDQEATDKEVITHERRLNEEGELEHVIQYVIPKCDIDKACKDTSNKVFSNDFSVKLELVVPMENYVADKSGMLSPPGSATSYVSDSEPEPPSEEERESDLDSDMEWDEQDKVRV